MTFYPQLSIVENPFTMMTSLEAVIQKMERSDELKSLRKRVLRPLDKPWIDRTTSQQMALADAAIDAEPDELIA